MAKGFHPKTGFKKTVPKTILITVDGTDISRHIVVSVEYKRSRDSSCHRWAWSKYKPVLNVPSQAKLEVVPSPDSVKEDEELDRTPTGNLTIVLQDPALPPPPPLPVSEDIEVS